MPTTRRSINLDTQPAEALRETLDRLRHEIAELRASRKRLVLAADADRRRIERDVHEGLQQHLVALAVNLQLAGGLTDTDPAAAKTLLKEMGRDVEQALDETAQLAERIYPPHLHARGLAATLRSAAARAGIPVRVDVVAAANSPPEAVATVYFCCHVVLEHAGAGARATITVREEEGALAFEVVLDAGSATAGERFGPVLDRLRDRLEAHDGRLTVRSEPGRGTRVAGSVPLSR